MANYIRHPGRVERAGIIAGMSVTSAQSPETILNTVFGYQEFKPLQREVIQNVLNKRDTMAMMPTGGGKSLCYQIPSLLLPGLTVVVSPLIALMKDQVEQLDALGVPALFLNSSLDTMNTRSIWLWCAAAK